MGVFKLGKMTFGSMFKKPETVLYPMQVKEQPPGLKGHIEIDAAACILCGMCDRSCSTNCITVSKPDRTWAIDRYQCVQCGYCITVCPKKCLAMNPSYAPAATEMFRDTVPVPEQEKPAKAAEPAAKAAVKERAPEAAPETPAPEDIVLEAKIALLDPAKAEKVRAALSR